MGQSCTRTGLDSVASPVSGGARSFARRKKSSGSCSATPSGSSSDLGVAPLLVPDERSRELVPSGNGSVAIAHPVTDDEGGSCKVTRVHGEPPPPASSLSTVSTSTCVSPVASQASVTQCPLPSGSDLPTSQEQAEEPEWEWDTVRDYESDGSEFDDQVVEAMELLEIDLFGSAGAREKTQAVTQTRLPLSRQGSGTSECDQGMCTPKRERSGISFNSRSEQDVASEARSVNGQIRPRLLYQSSRSSVSSVSDTEATTQLLHEQEERISSLEHLTEDFLARKSSLHIKLNELQLALEENRRREDEKSERLKEKKTKKEKKDKKDKKEKKSKKEKKHKKEREDEFPEEKRSSIVTEEPSAPSPGTIPSLRRFARVASRFLGRSKSP